MNRKSTRVRPSKKRRYPAFDPARIGLLAGIVAVAALMLLGKALLVPESAPIAVTHETQGSLSVSPETGNSPEITKPAATTEPRLGPPAATANETPALRASPVETPAATARETPALRTLPRETPPARNDPSVVPAATTRPERPLPRKGTLIFVFDDAGHNLRQLEPFLALPFPCTIAVLPGLEYSRDAAARARAAGKEVILHQPMQAINLSYDPGPGAIRKGMSAGEVRAVVLKNLDELWPVAGLNNHEGSLITSDRAAMGAVLDVALERNIYFLDSRTIAETMAPRVAEERNMKIWERAVFLDNIQERDDIIEALNSGLKIAERKGSAIMIGHIWSNELAQTLNDMYPDLVSQGFSLSTIAQIASQNEEEE